ncbi:MAG: 4-alpha-glucanotransferase, partial [Candidatus Omnitrophica bacterium]|nr:4-alpha-glucanotransferase [Candidatus Omnitrophota bacterium]
FPEEYCDYIGAVKYKERLFDAAYRHFRKGVELNYSYKSFCYGNSSWLEPYALFVVLKRHNGGKPWNEWEKKFRDKSPDAIRSARDRFRDEMEKEKFLQYIFFRQWLSLKKYCSKHNIKVIGDMPIYVMFDSSDVWNNASLFKLDRKKKPSYVSGVPPDCFSKSGQLWGNPVYRWGMLRKTGYKWWIRRFRHALRLFDIVRVDHFRGFVAFWQVPAHEKTAIRGRWVKAPANNFFKTLLKTFPRLPIIAEDLGIITPDVKKVMCKFRFPGMRVLLFAFGEDNPRHPYLPCNFIHDCVAYTGTHDNNTVKGWFVNEASGEEKKRLSGYLGHEVGVDNVNIEFIKMCESSISNTVIIPMQDILGLGQEARMNTPSKSEGNWRWRLSAGQLKKGLSKEILDLVKTYGRD